MVAGSETLVRRAQAGDAAALEALVAEQQRFVHGVALGVMKNPADAADMAQEALVRMVRAIGSYREETRFTTWLYRLVVNVCLDELRRRRRPVESLEGHGAWNPDDDGALQIADADRWGQPETRLVAEEVADEVRRALDRLTGAQRVALTLRYYEDMGDAEVATAMGVPVNTVKSHVHRAKARLYALLGGELAARPAPAPVFQLRGAAGARVAAVAAGPMS